MYNYILLLTSILTISEVTVGRPQNVLIEKQTMMEIPKEMIENDKHLKHLPLLPINNESYLHKTKEILNKIDEINRKTLARKEDSYEDVNEDFEDYSLLEDSSENVGKTNDFVQIIRPKFHNKKISVKDDFNFQYPDGNYIKRKIYHKMSYLVPNLMIPIELQPPAYDEIDDDDSVITYSSDSLDDRFDNFIERRLPVQLPTFGNFQPFIKQSQFFPMIVKNPFMSVLNGFTGIVEYGPRADNCETNKINSEKAPVKQSKNRNGKSLEAESSKDNSTDQIDRGSKFQLFPSPTKKITPINSIKTTTEKEDKEYQDIEDGLSKVFNPFKKVSEHDDGLDKRVPFGPFRHTPSTVENPGFFINRLRVRKGGVAIAGPGGIATAGGGGTAIVGPGGVAYTKPDGVAIAGPGAKVIGLPKELNLNKLIEKLSGHKIVDPEFDEPNSSIEGEFINKGDGAGRRIFIPNGGKIVATGPAIYKHEAK